MSIKAASLFASLMVFASGAAHALQSLPADAPLPSTLPGLVARRIQLDLARRLNVPPENIIIGTATPQTWSDQCLGLAQPNESCTDTETKGWRVEVESSQQRWVYRSNRAARRLYLEPLPNSTDFNQRDFSADISQTLLETVAQQVQQPVENLQILEVQAATWDSCVGIAEFGVTCTQETIPGFRVLVNDGPKDQVGNLQRDSWPEHREFQREWVYHLNEDVSEIIQNTTASDEKGRTATWFRRSLERPEDLAPQVVFQTRARNDFAGNIYITTLTADGTLSRELISSNPDDNAALEVIPSRQVSHSVATEFGMLLERKNFSNLDQMSYTNEDQYLATHGTFTLINYETVVEITAENEDLPADLQTILEAWETLITSFP
ncbi:hypothetical protein N836_21890 [Leptolyngbya sp. Heron Island J]|uniref:hypothetical protein n=1 Tax=Leptolyngbya sp. Heron Island J TaxID=1385935 RepID=UPI0003B96605|nr:hypothetical protein [Leptolyngbya sp. Heron Island J]ESA33341.1 hypothetical protein N836_21890 [Leptolyngbya sp. Heron Island J]